MGYDKRRRLTRASTGRLETVCQNRHSICRQKWSDQRQSRLLLTFIGTMSAAINEKSTTPGGRVRPVGGYRIGDLQSWLPSFFRERYRASSTAMTLNRLRRSRTGGKLVVARRSCHQRTGDPENSELEEAGHENCRRSACGYRSCSSPARSAARICCATKIGREQA